MNGATPNFSVDFPGNIDTKGNITNTGTITSTGPIIGKTPISLAFYGTPSCYNASSVLQTSGFTSTQIYNVVFPNYVNTYWVPSYTSAYKLAVPYNGLYSLQFTFSSGAGATFFQFITKNMGNGAEVAAWNENILASSCPALVGSYTNSISATAYLKTTDYVCFSIYLLSGSITYYNRCNAHLTLIQRTA
jgi:hypothetical protein